MIGPATQAGTGGVGRPAAAPSFAGRLREVGMFFDGTDRVHRAMRTVAGLFAAAKIEYVIVGGMAVNAHRHSRTTQDVDFLVRASALPALRDLVAGGALGAVAGRSRRFVEPATGVRFDVLVAGGFPGSGEPGPIAFPEPAAVREVRDGLHVVDLRTLVELKLAAGRYQDFADVVNLIRANGLDETYADRLHAAVRRDYEECLEEMRREDEYERRRDAPP